MMWLKKDADGQPNGGYSNPYCYHIDQFESLRPVYMRVIDYCRKMGLDMIQGDHEDSPGQLELNFTFDDALRTADRLATYRQICAQVAREFGIIACFMCKPFMGGQRQWLPPQHLAVAGRQGRAEDARQRRQEAARHGAELHLRQGRR